MKKVSLRHISLIATCILFTPAAFAEIGAKILWDYNAYDGVHHKNGNYGSGNEIRLVRLYLTNKFDEHWSSKVQVQISETEVGDQSETKLIWKEALLKYTGPVDLTIGKRKEPFGLQMLVNAENVLFLERSMISSAFAPERSQGLTLGAGFGASNLELGVYSQNGSGNAAYKKGGPDADNPEKETYALTGRFTFTPMQTDNSFIHLGLASSFRDFGDNEFQVSDNAEVHLAQKIVKSGKTIADTLNLFGLEAAAQFGPFSFQSEYMQLSVNADKGDKDAKYDGYYLQLGYFLTEGKRPYKKGNLGGVKPLSPNGTWQLLARYSVLDAEDNNAGVEVENISLGVNWFVNSAVRIAANYIMTQVDGVDKPKKDDGDAFSMRFQYVF